MTKPAPIPAAIKDYRLATCPRCLRQKSGVFKRVRGGLLVCRDCQEVDRIVNGGRMPWQR